MTQDTYDTLTTIHGFIFVVVVAYFRISSERCVTYSMASLRILPISVRLTLYERQHTYLSYVLITCDSKTIK